MFQTVNYQAPAGQARHHLPKLMVAASLLLTSMQAAPATEMLSDGDFDNLPVGSAPDKRQPAGAWQFTSGLQNFWAGDLTESYPEQFSIVETASFDSTRQGNSLRVDNRSRNVFGILQNVFEPPIPERVDGFLRLDLEILVPKTEDPGAVGLGIAGDHGFAGASTQTDLGPTLVWTSRGELIASICRRGTDCNGGNKGRTERLLPDFPYDEWQQVRIDYSLTSDDYDVYWATGGEELQLIGSDLGIRAQNQRHADFVNITSYSNHDSFAYFDSFSLQYVSTLPAIELLGNGGAYQQNFDEALGPDGDRGLALPIGWSGSDDALYFDPSLTRSFPVTSTRSRSSFYNAGAEQGADRALAIGVGHRTENGTLQLLADVTDSASSGFQLAFDVEMWDSARTVASLGEAAFDVTVELDTGDGFAPLADLGRVTTGATLFPTLGGGILDGNNDINRVTFDSGRIDAVIPADSQLRVRWTVPKDASAEDWVFGLDNVSLSLSGGEPVVQLLAGDADQDLDFDQRDLVQVQVANKYLSGEAATWGEGDWDGAPGGSPDNPPGGDGLFNQLDIVAAQQGAAYLTGPYGAIQSTGQIGDGQTSVVYSPATGDLSVDAPDGVQLTSINIDSASGIFIGDAAQNLGGSFDNDADANIFKATFGTSFGSLSFGDVAQAGLSEAFVRSDLSVVGSLAGGGDLGNVDLVYVPEPSAFVLLALGAMLGLPFTRRFV